MTSKNKKINRLLIQLMEECAEIQQASSKALRFGLRDTHHDTTPEQCIATELDDLRVVVMKLMAKGLDLRPSRKRQKVKWKKLAAMDRYSDKHGRI